MSPDRAAVPIIAEVRCPEKRVKPHVSTVSGKPQTSFDFGPQTHPLVKRELVQDPWYTPVTLPGRFHAFRIDVFAVSDKPQDDCGRWALAHQAMRKPKAMAAAAPLKK